MYTLNEALFITHHLDSFIAIHDKQRNEYDDEKPDVTLLNGLFDEYLQETLYTKEEAEELLREKAYSEGWGDNRFTKLTLREIIIRRMENRMLSAIQEKSDTEDAKDKLDEDDYFSAALAIILDDSKG